MKVAFKPEVRLSRANLQPEVAVILTAALDTAPAMQGDVLVVTSAADSKHGPKSLHPSGKAFDLRCFGQREGAIVAPDAAAQRTLAQLWVGRLRERLGRDYDVVLEVDHIHIELDPKCR